MRIIAHRSGPTVYPEQTVRSALLALKNGAELAELDTRFSADGVIIVSHDDNTERVFGVNRRTDEMTAAEFCALRHKNAPDFHGHTLKDFMDENVFPMLIHVKEGGERLSALLELLKENNCLDKVILGVSRTPDIAFIKRYDSSVKVLAFMKAPELYAESIAAGADYIRLWEGWFSETLFRKIKDLGKEVWIMTGNYDNFEVGYTSAEKLAYFQSLPVDGILLNDITTFRSVTTL